jgi:hypothetical protein
MTFQGWKIVCHFAQRLLAFTVDLYVPCLSTQLAPILVQRPHQNRRYAYSVGSEALDHFQVQHHSILHEFLLAPTALPGYDMEGQSVWSCAQWCLYEYRICTRETGIIHIPMSFVSPQVICIGFPFLTMMF